MNSEKILNNILRLNFDIKVKFYQKTEFLNKILEDEFQEYLYHTSMNKNLASNLVIFLGYLATILYIIIAFPKRIYFINCIVCFLLAVISLIISSLYKSRRVYFINNHIQIFLCSFDIICKGYFLCLMYNTEDNDNIEELLRIIIYNFFSTNIFLITKFEANIFLSIFYFLLNLSLIITGSVYSIKNRNLYLEAFTSFCTFLIFYALRKQWDYRIRLSFAEKQKFEKYYFYTLDYLDGLNGYNINVQNNKMIFYGNKFNSLVRMLIEDKFLNDLNSNLNRKLIKKNTNFLENEMIDGEMKQELDNMNNISNNLQEKDENKSIMYFDDYEFNQTNKDILIISLLKNLFYYKSYNSNNISMEMPDTKETQKFINRKKKRNYF